MASVSEPVYADKWTVGWGFSSRCDLCCPFCYSSPLRQNQPSFEVDIPLAKRFLATNGQWIHSFNFGTGECLLSPNFPVLLELCHQYAPQARRAVTTNGALADLSLPSLPAVKKYIQECDISLDFAEPEAHDHWRGKRGTWHRAIKAVELALALGLQATIVMIGTAQTFQRDNVQGLLNLAQKYRVAFRINLYMPTFGDYSFMPTIEAVFMVLGMLKQWSLEVRSSDRLLRHLMGNGEAANHSHIRPSCRIMPEGTISPSTYLFGPPWVSQASISTVRLPDLLSTEPFKRYFSPSIPKECQGCSVLLNCAGGCVERRWLWRKSLDMPDPLCPRLDPGHFPTGFFKQLPRQSEKWSGPTIHLDYLPTIIAIPPSG